MQHAPCDTKNTCRRHTRHFLEPAKCVITHPKVRSYLGRRKSQGRHLRRHTCQMPRTIQHTTCRIQHTARDISERWGGARHLRCACVHRLTFQAAHIGEDIKRAADPIRWMLPIKPRLVEHGRHLLSAEPARYQVEPLETNPNPTEDQLEVRDRKQGTRRGVTGRRAGSHIAGGAPAPREPCSAPQASAAPFRRIAPSRARRRTWQRQD